MYMFESLLFLFVDLLSDVLVTAFAAPHFESGEEVQCTHGLQGLGTVAMMEQTNVKASILLDRPHTSFTPLMQTIAIRYAPKIVP